MIPVGLTNHTWDISSLNFSNIKESTNFLAAQTGFIYFCYGFTHLGPTLNSPIYLGPPTIQSQFPVLALCQLFSIWQLGVQRSIFPVLIHSCKEVSGSEYELVRLKFGLNHYCHYTTVLNKWSCEGMAWQHIFTSCRQ